MLPSRRWKEDLFLSSARNVEAVKMLSIEQGPHVSSSQAAKLYAKTQTLDSPDVSHTCNRTSHFQTCYDPASLERIAEK
ncbi:hypothetical protein KCU78_g40, partial [Aureobasidium melanogenum]